ncbi:MAG: two pore domain potassium channel family protein [Deltaproteobacteria bacterium]|nr:two pore domain potassium channel family protein [Deltaproteobacteria bacterium]
MSEKDESRWPGPYATLLGALLFFLMLIPIVSDGGLGSIVFRFGFTAIFLSGIYIASDRRLLDRVEFYLVGVVLIVEWGTLFIEVPRGGEIRTAAVGCILFLTAFVQLKSLLKQDEVSTDTIFGGINVYVLMALAFMMLHTLAEMLQPGSYLIFGQELTSYLMEQGVDEVLPTMVYFSFVTITTLGYGDMVPVTGVSRILVSVEALFGQLYLATFVARIVGLYVGSRNAPQEAKD